MTHLVHKIKICFASSLTRPFVLLVFLLNQLLVIKAKDFIHKIMTNNPGVGLKLTAPRISSTSESTGPSPQSYDVPGSLHATDREKAQNELTSQRYTNAVSTHTTSSPSSSSLPLVTGSGQKRSREDEHDASKRHHSASK